MKDISIRILEKPLEISAVEDLQRQVWVGPETDVIPAHILIASVHNGGLIIGAYESEKSSEGEDPVRDTISSTDGQHNSLLIGVAFSFPGIYHTPDGPRLKHHSHILGVLPQYRDLGIGFRLKRAQWQMIRHQGLDRVTWTYDPLLSRNAHLNITRLGAVCNTYLPNYYGEMNDGMNIGLPSDRFQVDWWVNSKRVVRRLSQHPREALDLAHYLAAEISVINPTQISTTGFACPPRDFEPAAVFDEFIRGGRSLSLVEIPADFLSLKAADPELALEWRFHTRTLFELFFDNGYLVTDFVYLPGKLPRSFYVLSDGNSTL